MRLEYSVEPPESTSKVKYSFYVHATVWDFWLLSCGNASFVNFFVMLDISVSVP